MADRHNYAGFVKGLALTLYIGAALADADSRQRANLREQVRPLLDRYRATGDETELRAAVRTVRGQQWTPSGQWERQIRALGGEL